MSEHYILIVVWIKIDDEWILIFYWICLTHWHIFVKDAAANGLNFLPVSVCTVGERHLYPLIDKVTGVRVPDVIHSEAAGGDAAPAGGGSGALLIVPVLLIAALACCGVGLAARRIFTLQAHALAPGGVRRAQTGPMSAVELQRAVAAAEGPMVPLSAADSAAVQAVVVPAGREYHPEVERVV